jgi:hypothetical protein
MSEDKPVPAKIKIEYAEVIPKEENYKTAEQLSDEDYKVAPTSADEEKVKVWQGTRCIYREAIKNSRIALQQQSMLDYYL